MTKPEYLKKALSIAMLAVLATYCQSTGPQPKKIENFKGKLPTSDIQTYKEAQKLLQEGKALYNRKKFDKSLAKAEASINKFPSDEAWFLKGLNHSSKEEYGKASTAFQEAHKLNADDEQILFTYAVSSRLAGDKQGSLKAYEKLTEKQPKDAIYRFQYGLTHKENGQYKEALENFEQAEALRYKPTDALYVHMAETYAAMNQDSMATRFYKKAQEINPENRWAKQGESITSIKAGMRQGQQALKAKKYNEAIKNFQNVEKKNPRLAAAKLFLGVTYYETKKYTESKKKLQEALIIDPDLEDGYVYLARSFEKEGDSSGQYKILAQAEKTLPKSAKILFEKGEYYRQQGSYNEALSAYLKAKTVKPDFLPAYTNATVLYMQENRFNEAKLLLHDAESSVEANDRKEIKRLKELVEFSAFEHRVNKQLAAGRVKKAETSLASHKQYNALAGYHNLQGKTCFLKNKRGRSKKRFNRCEDSYQQALKKDSKYLPAMVNLKDLYSYQLQKVYKRKSAARRDTESKLKNIDKVIENNSGGGYVQALLKGIALEKKGDFDSAIKLYQGLKKKHPTVQVIKSRLAYCYLQKAVLAADSSAESKKTRGKKKVKANYKLAFSYLKRAKQEDPQYPGLEEAETTLKENQKLARYGKLINSARGHERQQQWKLASNDWQSLYNKIKTPDILYRQMKAEINGGNPAAADGLYRKGTKAFKNHPKWPLVASRYYSDREDYKEARKALQKYVAKNPKSAEAWYRLGILDLKEDKDREALRNFQQSLDYDNNFIPSRIGIGVVLHKQKQYKASRATFDQVLEEENDHGLANLNKGVSLFSNDLFKEARKHFNRVTGNDSLKGDAFYYLGFIDYLEKDYGSAEKNLRSALKQSPDEIYLFGLYKTMGRQKKEADRSQIVAEMVERYPAGRYTAQVMTGAQKTGNTKKKAAVALGKFDWPRSIKDQAHIQGGRLFFFDKTGLHRYNISGGSGRLSKSFKLKPVALRLDAMLYLLFNDHIKVVHTTDLETLHSIYLPQGGALGFETIETNAGAWFIVSYKDKSRLVSYNSEMTKEFSSSDLVEPVQSGLLQANQKKLTYHNLESGNSTEIAYDKENIVSLSYSKNRQRLLVESSKSITLYQVSLQEEKLSLKEVFSTPLKDITDYDFSQGTLAVLQKRKLTVYGDEKIELKTPKSRAKLKQVAASAQSTLVQLGKRAYLVENGKLVKATNSDTLVKKNRGREIIFAQSYGR